MEKEIGRGQREIEIMRKTIKSERGRPRRTVSGGGIRLRYEKEIEELKFETCNDLWAYWHAQKSKEGRRSSRSFPRKKKSRRRLSALRKEGGAQPVGVGNHEKSNEKLKRGKNPKRRGGRERERTETLAS